MKKLFAIVIATTLLFGTFLFSGCEDKMFRGDYKVTATAEEVRATLTELNVENLTAENRGYKIEFEIETDTETKISSQGKDVSVETKTNFNGNCSLKIEDGQITGSGKISGKTTGTGNGKLDINIYFDDQAVYLDMMTSTNGQEVSQKMKFSLADSDAPLIEAPFIPENFDLETLLAHVESGDILVYFDKSDGTKMKIVLTKDYFLNESGQDFLYPEASAEIFFAFDREGTFSGMKADISMKGNSDASGMLMENELSVELTMKAGDVKITVPDDLDTYVPA